MNQIALITKQVLCGAKLMLKNQAILGTTGLYIVIDNPEFVVEVVKKKLS